MVDNNTTQVKSSEHKEIDYASLPTIEQILEKNGFGVKFGQAEI